MIPVAQVVVVVPSWLRILCVRHDCVHAGLRRCLYCHLQSRKAEGIIGCPSVTSLELDAPGVDATPAMEGNGVDSRQVEVHQAYYQVMRAETAAARKEAEAVLAAILSRRHSTDAKFGAIASIAMKGDVAKAEQMLEGDAGAMENVACHQAALEATVKNCGPFNDYSMRYSRLFANLCAGSVDQQAIMSAIAKGCGQEVVV